MTFAAVNAPTHFSNVTVTHDVSFGLRTDEKLDIYAPKDARGPLPVIVYFYGGRWTFGDRAQYRFAGTKLAQAGYIVVIPDYRKYPAVRFSAFVEDAAAAVAWTSDHIAQYGGDPSQINLSGHSAGAHIASLVATNPAYLGSFRKDRAIIHSVAGLAGPYAFTPDEPDLIDMFGPQSNFPQMQATTFIDGKQPPILMLWGTADKTVHKINIDRMQAAIDKKGGCARTRIYEGVDHMDILQDLTWVGSTKAPVVKDMLDFFKNGCN